MKDFLKKQGEATPPEAIGQRQSDEQPTAPAEPHTSDEHVAAGDAKPTLTRTVENSQQTLELLAANDAWEFHVQSYFGQRHIRPESYHDKVRNLVREASDRGESVETLYGQAELYASSLHAQMQREGVLLYNPVTPGVSPSLWGGFGIAAAQVCAAAAAGCSALLGVGHAEAHVIPVVVLYVMIFALFRTVQEVDSVQEIGVGSIAIPYLPVIVLIVAATCSVILGWQGVSLSWLVWLIGAVVSLGLGLFSAGLCKFVERFFSYRRDWVWRAAARVSLSGQGFVKPSAVQDAIDFRLSRLATIAKRKSASAERPHVLPDRPKSLQRKLGRPGDVVGEYLAHLHEERRPGHWEPSADEEERGSKLMGHMVLSFGLATVGCAWYEFHHGHLVMSGLLAVLLGALILVFTRQASA